MGNIKTGVRGQGSGVRNAEDMILISFEPWNPGILEFWNSGALEPFYL